MAPDLFWRQEPGVDLSVTSEADWQHGLRLYQAYDRDAGVRDIKGTLNADVGGRGHGFARPKPGGIGLGFARADQEKASSGGQLEVLDILRMRRAGSARAMGMVEALQVA